MPGFAPIGGAPVGSAPSGSTTTTTIVYHSGAGAAVAHAAALGNLSGSTGFLKIAAQSAALVTLAKPAMIVAAQSAALAVFATTLVQAGRGAGGASAAARAIGQVKANSGVGAAAASAVARAGGEVAVHRGIGYSVVRSTALGGGAYISTIGSGLARAASAAAAQGNYTRPIATGRAVAAGRATAQAIALKSARGTATAVATAAARLNSNAGRGVAAAVATASGAGASSIALSGIGVSATLNDRLIVRETLTRRGGYAVTVAAGALVASRVTPSLGVIIRDRVKISLQSNPIWHMQVAVGDTVTLRTALRRLLRAALSDNLTLSAGVQTKLILQIIDKLIMHSSLIGRARLQAVLTSPVTLHDALIHALGARLASTIQLAATLTPLYKAIANAMSNATLHSTAAPVLLVSGVVRDGVKLHEINTIKALFGVTVMDLVMVDTGMSDGVDTLSVWQMNTRTAAVTEYTNYPFNSFGRLGAAVYIGAADDGLYELDGPDDQGSPVVAVLRGGYTQFGGTHLSRIKAAYLAVRGSGEFLLKIVTGPGEEYIYSANAQSLQSAKFQMGKGQRARYFAWELTSVGQDFDLDTLEFVPIEVQRRV